jgi:hypothetical protein
MIKILTCFKILHFPGQDPTCTWVGHEGANEQLKQFSNVLTRWMVMSPYDFGHHTANRYDQI